MADARRQWGVDAEAIIRGIIGVLNEGDVEKAMGFLAEDVVAVLQPAPPGKSGLLRGLDEMRANYERFVNSHEYVEFTEFQVCGNRAVWSAKMWEDHFRDLGVTPIEFEGVGIVQGGKLKSYTWQMTEETLMRIAAAEGLEANKQAVRRYLKAWEQGDLATLDKLMADELINHSPPLPSDKAGMMGHAADFRRAFPAGEYVIDELVAKGDRVYVFGHCQGKHEGEPFMDISASGAQVRFDFSLRLRLEEGQIVERWATADDVMGLLVPLGYTLSPPEG